MIASSGTSIDDLPQSKRQLRSGLLFLGKFFRQGRRIGSVWPSSKTLSRAALREVDWARAKVIVELGAGTGPITAAIVEKADPKTRILSIERDGDFARILKKRFAAYPNIEIIHADVRDIDAILESRGIAEVDYFISGLATPSLPLPIQRRIFAAVRKYLPPDGVFANITEVPLWYRRYYKGLFTSVKFQFVPTNIPPGGVYHCRAMRSRKRASKAN